MVQVAVPGQRWEIEVLIDGTVDIEVFRNDGEVQDAPLWMLFFRILLIGVRFRWGVGSS